MRCCGTPIRADGLDRSEDRRPQCRTDIIEQDTERWVQSCPSTEGGHNWQAMRYHSPTNLLIIPLSQSCMEMWGRKIEFKDGSGGTGADRRFFEMRAATATSASWQPTTRRR